jgi:hypothetical protein
MQMDLKYNEDDEKCVLTDRSSVYILLFPHPHTHFPNFRSLQMSNCLCKVHNKSHDGL